MMTRKQTRPITFRGVTIGGDAPILIQSMTNTRTEDIEATYRQIRALEEEGCEAVRLALPTQESAATISALLRLGVKIPLIADIHYDYKIALRAIREGVHKIRINPGNIGSREKTLAVVKAAKAAGVPIRIGVNSGSLEDSILKKYGAPTPEALVESALYHARILEDSDFFDICISVKASSVPDMIRANRLLSEAVDYPIHLGVTEAGGSRAALVKSSVGIGTLLAEGIGDTVRVSLTDDPVEEINAAREILSSLGLYRHGKMDIVSCPTCGRTSIDLISLVREFEERVHALSLDKKPLRIALMGCAVNGPGEARECDLGIAGGKGEGLLFKKGEILCKVKEEHLIDALIEEIQKM